MTDREKLVEVMARALNPIVWDSEPSTELLGRIRNRQREMAVADAKAAIDAAERAGFRWVGPDDGR